MKVFSYFFLICSSYPLVCFAQYSFDHAEEEIEKLLSFGKNAKQTVEEEHAPALSLKIAEVICSTLENQWNIKIAKKNILRQSGVLQTSHGPFDPLLEASYQNTWMHDPQVIDFKTKGQGWAGDLNFNVSKLARLGTLYTFKSEIQEIFNNANLLIYPYNRSDQSTFTFTIDQPLLRRLVYNSEAVTEIVSDLELKALKKEFLQTVSEQIKTAIQDYWDLVAANKIHMVNIKTVEILKSIASSTERLIEGDRLAPADLNEQFAEICRESRDQNASEQDVYAAYNLLLYDMGQTQEEFLMDVPNLDLDEFPDIKRNKEEWRVQHLLELAEMNRGDLLASALRIREANWNLRLAKREVLPDLDVKVAFNYTNSTANNAAKPFFSSVSASQPEKDLIAEVRLSFPIFNNKARGEKRQRRAELSERRLLHDKLNANVRTNVATALRAQLELIDRVQYADCAAEKYIKTLKEEIKRYKAGYSTLFILIDYENRLRQTLIERILSHAEYAKNIVELLFQTGLLVQNVDSSEKVCIQVLNYEQLLKKYGT